MIGYVHTRQVVLPEPFEGALVRDLAGGGHFLARPAGLVDLGPLPDGWTPGGEEEVPSGSAPRWRRTWTRLPADDSSRQPATLELYQAFGGPADVGGGDEQRTVTVNGQSARLFREPETGELVLVWRLGTDGLALVADEQDLPLGALIRLAETARPASG
jgi:hypothetical protein